MTNHDRELVPDVKPDRHSGSDLGYDICSIYKYCNPQPDRHSGSDLGYDRYSVSRRKIHSQIGTPGRTWVMTSLIFGLLNCQWPDRHSGSDLGYDFCTRGGNAAKCQIGTPGRTWVMTCLFKSVTFAILPDRHSGSDLGYDPKKLIKIFNKKAR